MSDIEQAKHEGAASTMSSPGAKNSHNNIKLVVDLGDKGAMEIPLIGKLVVDLQQNSDAVSTVNSGGAKDLQNNVKLVVDLGDKGTMEIPLTGKLVVSLQQSSSSALPRDAEDKDQQFLTEMRGWMVTVATLFVSMAFQAAMQPPGWMPRGDWVRILPKHQRTTTGASSVSSHADRPAMPAPSPSPPPPAITVGQARMAQSYVNLNASIFGTALTLVLILLLMTKKQNAKYIMWTVKFFMVVLACCVASAFVQGSSDVPSIRKRVSLIIAAFALWPIAYVIHRCCYCTGVSTNRT